MAGRPRVFTDEELLEAIRRFHRTYGRVPRMIDLGEDRDPGLPSAQTLVRRFGSFANAVERAGFERPRRGRRPIR